LCAIYQLCLRIPLYYTILIAMDIPPNIKKEFFILTRLLLGEKPTNKISDNNLRKDYLFPLLAERVFDNPKILKVLKNKISSWLSQDNSEMLLSLAAYVYYLDCDFNKAKKYFLKAVEKNPQNLDNWLDLAICLHHCSPALHNLSKAILFDYDLFIEDFNKKRYKECSIEGLKRIQKRIIAQKIDYAHTFRSCIDKQILETYSKPKQHKTKTL